ncbi:Uncharacterised protein [Serratia marcescens]|nr:Uncharacterised protein [Serratia marcescens]
MGEVVVFNAGERQREIILAERSGFAARQQRDRLPFPHAPKFGRFKLHLRIGRGQPLPVGGDHVFTLVIREDGQHALPFFREEARSAVLVIPMQLLLAQGEDAAQHHLTDALRVRLRISERQRRSPGTAEHQPLIDAGHFAQPLDIGHQMPGGVVVQAGMRTGAAATALIEQQHLVAFRIEQLTMMRGDAAARPAVNEYRRFTVRVTAQLPVDPVAIPSIQPTAVVCR